MPSREIGTRHEPQRGPAAPFRERPILFSAPMVRALLSGSKTQTRRLIKPQPPTVEAVKAKAGIDYIWFTDDRSSGRFRVAGPVWAVRECGGPESIACPYGKPGDRLWVRETWETSGNHEAALAATGRDTHDGPCFIYAADMPDPGKGWRPSIFMPRGASRITLEVTDVRVQRLQDISEADAWAEGIGAVDALDADGDTAGTVETFAALWDSINGKRAPWSTSPWTWALTFRRLP